MAIGRDGPEVRAAGAQEAAGPEGAGSTAVELALVVGEGNPDMNAVLVEASGIISGLLTRLRESETALRSASLRTLQKTSDKLEEVNTATETAANQIMDGLDRSLALIDRLDEGESQEEIGNLLRDELMDAMTQLQFQDIAAQQLSHALSLLSDVETHLETFARLFEKAGFEIGRGSSSDAGKEESAEAARTFDPEATFDSAEDRQALVDQLLSR